LFRCLSFGNEENKKDKEKIKKIKKAEILKNNYDFTAIKLII